MLQKNFFSFLSCALLMGFATTAGAATSSQYFGMQGMINIASPLMGTPDSDAKTMMAGMNVPAQTSPMGPGKSILAEGNILNYICGERGQGQVQCSIIIQKSAHAKLSASEMIYEITGEEAAVVHSKFHPNQDDGSYQFTTEDGALAVTATPDLFRIYYRK